MNEESYRFCNIWQMPLRSIFFKIDEIYSGILQAFNERKIGAEMVFILLSKCSIYTFEFIRFEIFDIKVSMIDSSG